MSLDNGTTFVLVHGAFHGGWCWDAVAEQLRARGHRVFAPTLSGLSERRDGFSGGINLNTHVTDVISLIDENNLAAIHLVGWSYGGMVITGVLGAAPKKIRAMTYLDAHLPAHHYSAASYLNVMERLVLRCVGAFGVGISAPEPRKWGIEDASLLAEIAPKLSAQPPRTFTQPVYAPEPWPEQIGYSYIRCRGYSGSVFDQFYAKAVADARFSTAEITASHAAVLTHPTDVAHALVRA
ncbi:MAG: alpha/beta fold hydrolase [Gammaproteobacteria bacterium]|nr:alpha/beta fold hydrolase [Gammaproteobacteria bacterium]